MITKYKIEGKNNPIFLKLFVDNRVKITDHIKFQLHSDKSPMSIYSTQNFKSMIQTIPVFFSNFFQFLLDNPKL